MRMGEVGTESEGLATRFGSKHRIEAFTFSRVEYAVMPFEVREEMEMESSRDRGSPQERDLTRHH